MRKRKGVQAHTAFGRRVFVMLLKHPHSHKKVAYMSPPLKLGQTLKVAEVMLCDFPDRWKQT